MDPIGFNTDAATGGFGGFDWDATSFGGAQCVSAGHDGFSSPTAVEQSLGSLGWSEGDAFDSNIDPWFSPSTFLGQWKPETLFPRFDDVLKDPGLFPGDKMLRVPPGVIDRFPGPGAPWPHLPIFPCPENPFPGDGFPGFPSPVQPFPGSEFPDFPMPSPLAGGPIHCLPYPPDPGLIWIDDPMPNPIHILPFPLDTDSTIGYAHVKDGGFAVPGGAVPGGFSGAGEAGFSAEGRLPIDGSARSIFEPSDFARRLAEGSAKAFQESQSAVLDEAARRAGEVAELSSKHSRAINDLFSRLAGDPNVSDETVQAVRDSFFEAMAYSKQADAIAESARDAVGQSKFYGTLAGGTVDALSGAERLLDAERRIREASDPREAYRIMWETTIRFPLDVLLAAPNKLGLTGNLGAGYAADGASSYLGDSIADATFDTVNGWAHQLSEWKYWPDRLKPAYPLN